VSATGGLVDWTETWGWLWLTGGLTIGWGFSWIWLDGGFIEDGFWTYTFYYY
jgi:hypothetical protein